jgi:hypothetical protein
MEKSTNGNNSIQNRKEEIQQDLFWLKVIFIVFLSSGLFSLYSIVSNPNRKTGKGNE